MSSNYRKLAKSNEIKILCAKLILFVIMPIVPVIWSVLDLKHKSSFVILFLYGTLIGYCFTLNEATGFDSLRYVEVFENIKVTFFFDFMSWISGESDVRDFYLHILSYVVSIFSSSYHLLFMAAAIFFSLFSLSTLKMVVNQDEYQSGFVCSCIVFLLLMSNSIININGFRFWTACWYVVWCVFNTFIKGKRCYFFLILISPFFHSSMFVFIVLSLIFVLTRNRVKMWKTLSIMSIFISSVSIILFQNISDFLPSALQSTINFYTDAEYIAERGSGTGWTWVENLFRTFSMFFLMYSLIVVGRDEYQNRLSSNQKKLYVFALCLLSFANFTTSIPSLGGRFIVMVYPFVAYFLIKYSKEMKIRRLCKLIPIVMSFQTLLIFRDMYMQLLPSKFFISSLLFLI